MGAGPTVPSDPHEPDYVPPPYQLATWLVLGGALIGVLGLFSLRTELSPDRSRAYPARALAPDIAPVLLPTPEMESGYFPCSDCHEDEILNPTERILEDDHEDLELRHGKLWCMHCHDLDQRDLLHLADQTPVEFDDSWQLCTQCHAKKLQDWRAGVHGKRTGHWSGPKEYRTCVVCHDPHSPRFKPMRPEPPPRRPEAIAGLLDGETGVSK